MINRFALTLVLVGGVCFLGRTEAGSDASDLEDLFRALNTVRQEIAEAETEFLGQAAARFRHRHRAEFDIDEIVPYRLEAKQREKEQLEAREAFNQHLRTRYPDYRDLEVRLGKEHDVLRERQLDSTVIAREIAQAERKEEPDPEQLATLQEDLSAVVSKIMGLQEDIEATREELEQVRATILIDDEEASLLYEHFLNAQQAYLEANARLQGRVDDIPVPDDIEQGRIDAANRLHELRRQEQEILEAITRAQAAP